jgi:tetratricopeptide (TPR) repeat protein
MKRLNFKLALSLLVGFAVLGTGVHFLHAFQVDRNAEGILEQADSLYKKGDLQPALEFAVRYLRLRNEDARGSKLLADIAFDIAQQPKATRAKKRFAIQEMERALRLDRDDAKRRRKLLDYYVESGWIIPAIDHVKLLRDPKVIDVELELIAAKCFAATGNYDDAADVCRKLIGYDAAQQTFSDTAPGRESAEAYAILADLFRENKSGSSTQADGIIEQMIAVAGDDSKAQLFAYWHWKRSGKPDQAKAALAEAHKLDAESPEVSLLMAQEAIEEKRIDDAEQLVKSALAEHPDNPWLYRAMAEIELRRRRPAEAVKVVDGGLAVLPDNEVLLGCLVQAHLDSNKLDEAKEVYKKLQTLTDDPGYEVYEAQFLMREQKWAQAIDKLKQTRSRVMNNPSLVVHIETLQGKCHQALGQLKEAAELYGNVAAKSEDISDADLGIAQVLATTGRNAEALVKYEEIAAKLAEKSLEHTSLWRPLLALRTWDQLRLPKAQQNWSKVETLINDLNAAGKLEPISYVSYKAGLLANKGDIAGARQLFANALHENPNNETLWSSRIDLELRDGGPEKAMQVADQAPAALQSGLALRLARAAVFSKMDGDAGKNGLLALEKDSSSLSEQERIVLLRRLVLEHRERKDRDSAMRLLRRMMDEWPKDHVSRYVAFEMAREDGKIDEMAKIAAEMKSIFSADRPEPSVFDAVTRITKTMIAQRANAKPNQARFDLTAEEKADIHVARKLLEDVIARYPAWNEPYKWMADVCGFENDTDGMIEQLQMASKTGPIDARRTRQLYELLVAKGLNDEAEKVHAQLKGAGLEGTQWSQLEIMFQENRIDEARNLVDSMPPATDAPIDELLRHANARRRLNDLDKAEAVLRQAVQTDSTSIQAWVLLVNTLATANKQSEAEAAIANAEKLVPAEQRELVLAQCYETMGDVKQAEQNYLKVAADRPQDFVANQAIASFYLRYQRYQDAAKYLDAILRGTPQTPADHDIFAWSKRGRAVVLASEGSWQKFQEAETLLRESTEEIRKQGGEPTSTDLLLHISLLTNRSEPSSLRAALALFEELQRRQPLQTSELVNLARLYERVGEWQRCKEVMLSVLAARNVEPLHYLAFAEMLLRNGEYNDVESWLNQYDRLAKDRASLPIRLTLRVRQKRDREAVQLLNTWVGRLDAPPWPEARLNQVKAAAEKMQTLHQYAEAERLWRAYVKAEPNGTILLARCIGMYRELDDAFGLLEESLKYNPPQAALLVGLQILRARKADAKPNHYTDLGRWYQAALQAAPGDPRLDMAVGDMYEIRGQLDKAEGVYRKLLEQKNIDPTLRAGIGNNLAFLLAAQRKNTDEAVRLIASAMEVYGPSSDLLDTRGVVYLAAGKPTEALADFKEAVLDPTPMKWVHLAFAQTELGSEEGARTALKKAQEMDLKREDLYDAEWTRYQKLASDLGML